MRKENIRNILLSLFIFFAGFFTHAIFFPGLLTNNLYLYSKQILENKPQVQMVENKNSALTIAQYNEGEFDPQVVVMGKSYYLGIVNNSDRELMNLTSKNPLLRTPRGYGKSEQLLVQLYEVGEFEVSSTLHPDKVLKVIVK